MQIFIEFGMVLVGVVGIYAQSGNLFCVIYALCSGNKYLKRFYFFFRVLETLWK